jgi:uncharacterized protein (TIGR02453 family)
MASEREPFFTADLFQFLRELTQHNDRAWFQANKGRYEAAVLQPSVRFVREMGPRLAALSPRIVADPRPFGGSVARIYRDTRFSKDKTPYRTNVGIHFAHEMSATAEEHLPGFYLHLAPGENEVYSGVWHPTPPGLARIRDAIVSDPKGWTRVRAKCPPSGGESYVRVPSGYAPDHRFAEDLRRKDFFAGASFQESAVTSAAFGASFVAACTRLDPLNRFLAKALQVPW